MGSKGLGVGPRFQNGKMRRPFKTLQHFEALIAGFLAARGSGLLEQAGGGGFGGRGHLDVGHRHCR